MSDTPDQINFETFVLSVGTAAMMALGEIENPITKKKEADIGAARQNIDILEILLEKTKGNLNEREEKVLSSVLYETRVKFVDQSKASKDS